MMPEVRGAEMATCPGFLLKLADIRAWWAAASMERIGAVREDSSNQTNAFDCQNFFLFFHCSHAAYGIIVL